MRWSAPAVREDALGRRCLERAVTLDPQNARARSALAELRHSDRRTAIQGRLQTAGARDAFDAFSDATYAAISALPADDRLVYLPGAAESAYVRAEYIDYTAREKPAAEQTQARKRAAQGFARARQYADDALALARNDQQAAQDNDVIYRAETVLGVLALKDGDREAAVEHMPAGSVGFDNLAENAASYRVTIGICLLLSDVNRTAPSLRRGDLRFHSALRAKGRRPRFARRLGNPRLIHRPRYRALFPGVITILR